MTIPNGGEITGCKAPDNFGGGIYAEGAAVTVKGTISGCEAKFGGGVFGSGTLNIEEKGAIDNCKATTHGGGVFVNGSEVELTMNGGEITDCTALQGGGVFFREGKTFTLNAGEISRCTATGNMANGGGVFLQKIETFSMSGGTISHNTAPYLGGGIYMGQEDTPAGSYKITAGEISHNSVTDPYGFGGGIYVQKGITLNLANTLVTGNTASALGGGIWACRTGDIKLYVTDGGAVYGNDAQAGGIKTPNQAGDDIAFVASLGTASTMTLYQKMLGGGFNHYYKDGGITWLEPGADHTAGLGLGAPDGQTSRYGDNYMELCTDTENMTGFTALKNVVSDEAKSAAQTSAKLTITGNSASRGGGIGTNGNLIIGKPDSEVYSAIITKEWSDDTPEEKKTAVSIYLKIGEELLGPVILNAANGWKTIFTGLTDAPNTVAYAVVEDPIPDSFTPAYQDAIISDHTISLNVTNQYNAPVPTPETGSLTVSKTVSGDGASSAKAFTFTVTLTDTMMSGIYGDMTFENGAATFTLKDGESKTASNLPAGVGYTVAESDNEGYTVTVDGTSNTTATGTIVADTTATATFNNHKSGGGKPDPVPEYGSLSVTKTVSGYGDTSKEFTFVVTLGDTTISGDYGDMKFTSGVATVKLKHGQTVKAINLPAGVTYNVVELEGNTDGYTTSAVGEGGTIQANETAEVIFNNYKDSSGEPSDSYTSISVKKVWVLDDGGAAADSVTIALLKNGAEHKTIELSEINGWSHTWSGLNDRYIWTVQEIDVPDGFSMSVAQSGYTFTITNDDMPDTPDDPDEPDSPDEPAKPDEPSTPDTPDTPDELDNPGTPENPGLPQTGQLWWPVVLTLVLGLALLTVGALDTQRHRYHGKHKQ